jgi:D-threonate/D-erythronate kinase
LPPAYRATDRLTPERSALYHGHHMGPTPLGMIAHDFTGAMDSLAAFVETPGDTVVLLAPGDASSTALNLAVVAETQTASPDAAYAGVREAARRLAGRRLFKRVSSTLRGNIGPEIRAVLDETGGKALVCPALPREGRTVVGGVGRLDSVPLHLTEYGRDPVTPCRQSSLPAILRDHGVDGALVSLSDVRRGVNTLRDTLVAVTRQAVVVDAETDDDLRTIAHALASLGPGWCACASSGLSPHLADALGRSRVRAPRAPSARTHAPMLAVIGSTSSVSAAQVAFVQGHGDVAVVTLRADQLYGGGAAVAGAEMAALSALARGRHAVLTTSLSPVVPELRALVAPLLAGLAGRVITQSGLSALMLSGGMTALETCRALGIESVQVTSEVEPGVVSSHGVDCTGTNRTIVSKAGGFGDAGALARVLRAGG